MSVVRNLPIVRERKQAILEGDSALIAEQKTDISQIKDILQQYPAYATEITEVGKRYGVM